MGILEALLAFLVGTKPVTEAPEMEIEPDISIVEEEPEVPVEIVLVTPTPTPTPEPTPEPEPEPWYSEDDIYELALVTLAEAESEPLHNDGDTKAWRLVIDTVLNRVDDSHFPSTIHDVIYQSGQFTSMTNGRAEKVRGKVDEDWNDILKVVEDELNSERVDSNVLFFTSGGFGRYGTPAYQYCHHYFCYW